MKRDFAFTDVPRKVYGFRNVCPYCKKNGVVSSGNGDRKCVLCDKKWNEFTIKHKAGRKIGLGWLESDRIKRRVKRKYKGARGIKK